jgi:uncharacterized protein YpmB
MFDRKYLIAVTTILISLVGLGVAFAIIGRKNEDAVSIAPAVSIKTETTKGSLADTRSEVDAYGTDLYALKQGETEKKSGDITVIYTRDKDSVVRKMTKSLSGGISNETVTIDLNARKTLVTTIGTMEANYAKECQNSSVAECLQGKAVLDVLKGDCSAMSKTEDISRCIANSIFAAQQFYTQYSQSPAPSVSKTIDRWGVDFSTLNEGLTVKIFSEPVDGGSTIKHTVTYNRSGDNVRIKDDSSSGVGTLSVEQEVSITQLRNK